MPSIFYDFFKKLVIATQGGVQSDPGGHDLNKLDRGPLGNAACKISKLYASWFKRRRFLKFLLYISI